jgi:hypothetical protein
MLHTTKNNSISDNLNVEIDKLPLAVARDRALWYYKNIWITGQQYCSAPALPERATRQKAMENPETETPEEAILTTEGPEGLPGKSGMLDLSEKDREEYVQAVMQTTELLRRLGVVACRPLDDQVEIDDEVYYSLIGFDNVWFKDRDIQPGDYIALDEDFHTLHILRTTTYATVGSEGRSMTKYFFRLAKKMDGVLPAKSNMVLTIVGYLLMVIVASTVIIYLILRFFT